MNNIDAALLMFWPPALRLIVQERALRFFVGHCFASGHFFILLFQSSVFSACSLPTLTLEVPQPRC